MTLQNFDNFIFQSKLPVKSKPTHVQIYLGTHLNKANVHAPSVVAETTGKQHESAQVPLGIFGMVLVATSINFGSVFCKKSATWRCKTSTVPLSKAILRQNIARPCSIASYLSQRINQSWTFQDARFHFGNFRF